MPRLRNRYNFDARQAAGGAMEKVNGFGVLNIPVGVFAFLLLGLFGGFLVATFAANKRIKNKNTATFRYEINVDMRKGLRCQ